jgi:hypothetical protein
LLDGTEAVDEKSKDDVPPPGEADEPKEDDRLSPDGVYVLDEMQPRTVDDPAPQPPSDESQGLEIALSDSDPGAPTPADPPDDSTFATNPDPVIPPGSEEGEVQEVVWSSGSGADSGPSES